MTQHYWSNDDGQDLKQFRDSLQQQQQQQKAEIARLKQEAETKEQTAIDKMFNATEKQKEAKQLGNSDAIQKAEQARQEAQSAIAEAKEAETKLAEAQEKASKTETLKREASQSIGENYGDKFCTEKLGYQEVLHGDSKTIKQGFDSVYYDPKTKETVVVEFKGQDSQLSEQQKKISWTPEVVDKVLAREGQYKGASEQEWQTAQQVKDTYSKGELRYEVVRTKVDSDGRLSTELEKTTRPSEPKEMRQNSEVWSKHENQPDTYKAMDQYLGVQKQANTETQTQTTTETKTDTYSQSNRG